MSEESANPKPAIDALVGKEYSFRGRPLKFSMACFFALESAGIPLSQMDAKPIETAAIVFYAASKPKELVWNVIRRGVIAQAAAELADTLSPAEFIEAKSVADAMLSDYLASVATYRGEDDEKNR